jgi:hypothetical protein
VLLISTSGVGERIHVAVRLLLLLLHMSLAAGCIASSTLQHIINIAARHRRAR